ncbi:MAG: hypothetical protein M5R36_15060 [Deltaproteobacteria bacterium]|nr:hypothetical protein [Deltaproteobacteria bacterium]
MSYTCDMVKLSTNLEPLARWKFPSVICNYVKYVPESRNAYLTGFPFFLHRFDLESAAKGSNRFLLLTMWVEPVPGRREIVVNGLRSVAVLDPVSLKTIRTIRTKIGIRSLAVDAKRNLVYVAHYFYGEMAAYDLDSGELKATLYLGHLLRVVHYSVENDRIYAGSARGIFEVEPDTFLALSEDG